MHPDSHQDGRRTTRPPATRRATLSRASATAAAILAGAIGLAWPGPGPAAEEYWTAFTQFRLAPDLSVSADGLTLEMRVPTDWQHHVVPKVLEARFDQQPQSAEELERAGRRLEHELNSTPGGAALLALLQRGTSVREAAQSAATREYYGRFKPRESTLHVRCTLPVPGQNEPPVTAVGLEIGRLNVEYDVGHDGRPQRSLRRTARNILGNDDHNWPVMISVGWRKRGGGEQISGRFDTPAVPGAGDSVPPQRVTPDGTGEALVRALARGRDFGVEVYTTETLTPELENQLSLKLSFKQEDWRPRAARELVTQCFDVRPNSQADAADPQVGTEPDAPAPRNVWRPGDD